MTVHYSEVEKGEELADEHAINRIERLTSMGQPSCDACLSLDSEDRPEDGECFPDPLTIFVDGEGETLAKWMNKTVCDYHNPAIGESEGIATEATHRVRVRTEYVGDEHHHPNGAYRYNVLSVKEDDR